MLLGLKEVEKGLANLVGSHCEDNGLCFFAHEFHEWARMNLGFGLGPLIEGFYFMIRFHSSFWSWPKLIRSPSRRFDAFR